MPSFVMYVIFTISSSDFASCHSYSPCRLDEVIEKCAELNQVKFVLCIRIGAALRRFPINRNIFFDFLIFT